MKKTKRAKLIDEADELFQAVGIAMKPKSTVSGKPTEVIHHFIPKSQSNNLRYDLKNGVPLTNGEHTRHHRGGDPEIAATIIKNMGNKWYDDLQARRRIFCKLNIGYLEGVIINLESKLKRGEWNGEIHRI